MTLDKLAEIEGMLGVYLSWHAEGKWSLRCAMDGRFFRVICTQAETVPEAVTKMALELEKRNDG